MKKRRTKKRIKLSDVMKAAHDAGASVSVSLTPKETVYWQVAYRSSDGSLHSGSVNSALGAAAWVATLLDRDAHDINVMRGVIKES